MRASRLVPGPLPEPGDLVTHGLGDGPSPGDLVEKDLAGEFLFGREGGVESRHDALLDLGPAEAVGRLHQLAQIESGGILAALLQMDAEEEDRASASGRSTKKISSK